MFIAVMEQKGAGCDYTIECGTAVIYIKNAKTMEEAIAYLMDHDCGLDIIDFYGGSDEISTCNIYEVSNSCDFLSLHKKAVAESKKRDEEKKKIDDEKLRRATYEKLKNEFEK